MDLQGLPREGTPAGYTLQLVSAAEDSDRSRRGQFSEDPSRRRALDHVSGVLADAYGPFVFQQVWKGVVGSSSRACLGGHIGS